MLCRVALRTQMVKQRINYAAQHSYVPLLSLRRDSPSQSSRTFSVRPRSSVGRVTVDLIRRSWVRFPARSKDFFFTSCGSLIPFTRANAQWVIHGFNKHFNLHRRVNSLFHHLTCMKRCKKSWPKTGRKTKNPSKKAGSDKGLLQKLTLASCWTKHGLINFSC